MKINFYCLSLEKYRKERFLVTQKNSFIPNNIPIIEVAGIDGSLFKSSEDIAKKYELILDDQMLKSSPILIAIAQSHRNTWHMFLESDDEYAIIFEDDIEINTKNFINEINKILLVYKKLENPKLLSLGYLYSEKGNKIDNNISTTSKFSGLQCYLINRETAKYLYKNTCKLNNQIDTIIADTLKINKFYLNHPLVFQKNIASIAHNQRYIFLEYHNIKFLSKRIGINFKLNIGSSYHINFTYYTLLNIIVSIFLRMFFKFNQWILINYFIFYVIETFIYGGVNWLDYDLFRGINQISRYDDDEVVNKLIDFLIFFLFYLII